MNSNSKRIGWPFKAVFGVVLLLGAIGQFCRAGSPPVPHPTEGGTYYTQFAFFHEDYVHETTNYRKRTLVPINTPVTFVKVRTTSTMAGPHGVTSSLKNFEIIVKLPEGKELRIVNVNEYSGEELDGIFARTFGKEKVDLGKFSPFEVENISKGEVALGMSKAAVIRAMGYPPKHKTPSLTADEWTYWRSRMVHFSIRFSDDKVVVTQ